MVKVIILFLLRCGSLSYPTEFLREAKAVPGKLSASISDVLASISSNSGIEKE